ncbi:MAG: hypothetical protein ABIG95_00620 [Candidatus Woesearchaeota archaeon]
MAKRPNPYSSKFHVADEKVEVLNNHPNTSLAQLIYDSQIFFKIFFKTLLNRPYLPKDNAA